MGRRLVGTKDDTMNEGDTCRKHVFLKLVQAGWDTKPYLSRSRRHSPMGASSWLATLQSDDLRCLQSETDGELNALMPSFRDRAFRGEIS
jgi:hypothetical protein